MHMHVVERALRAGDQFSYIYIKENGSVLKKKKELGLTSSLRSGRKRWRKRETSYLQDHQDLQKVRARERHREENLWHVWLAWCLRGRRGVLSPARAIRERGHSPFPSLNSW